MSTTAVCRRPRVIDVNVVRAQRLGSKPTLKLSLGAVLVKRPPLPPSPPAPINPNHYPPPTIVEAQAERARLRAELYELDQIVLTGHVSPGTKARKVMIQDRLGYLRRWLRENHPVTQNVVATRIEVLARAYKFPVQAEDELAGREGYDELLGEIEQVLPESTVVKTADD